MNNLNSLNIKSVEKIDFLFLLLELIYIELIYIEIFYFVNKIKS